MTLSSILLRVISSLQVWGTIYLGKLIIDEIVKLKTHDTSHSYLWKLLFYELLLVISIGIVRKILILIETLHNEKFRNDSELKLLSHASKLDLEHFEDSEFYNQLDRSKTEGNNRTRLISHILNQFQGFNTILFLSIGLIHLYPLAIILIPVIVFPSFAAERYFDGQTYNLFTSRTSERRKQGYYYNLGTNDANAKEIKIFGLSDYIIEHLKNLADSFYESNKTIAVKSSFWGMLFSVVGNIGHYFVYGYIIFLTVSGKFSLGQMAFIAGSVSQLKGAWQSVLELYNLITKAAFYVADYFDFFELKPNINNSDNPLPFPVPIIKGFSFVNVGFKYPKSDRWVIRNLNFQIYQGEKLALVGENGAGKTTIVKLLVRLYEPTEGQIFLDDVNLKDYDIADLRNNVGVIFQDFLKYQMTFSNNIAVGNIQERDNGTLIKEAAMKALAHSITERLPLGYNQLLGKRFHDGLELSGGEWQKIALARAYLRNGELLILDEPTSALDARAEAGVFERFYDLSRKKTAIFISHRFSTVRLADRILVLDEGKLKEIGTHNELLNIGGKYAELFNLQALGYQ